jgi:hypothetical protein
MIPRHQLFAWKRFKAILNPNVPVRPSDEFLENIWTNIEDDDDDDQPQMPTSALELYIWEHMYFWICKNGVGAWMAATRKSAQTSGQPNPIGPSRAEEILGVCPLWVSGYLVQQNIHPADWPWMKEVDYFNVGELEKEDAADAYVCKEANEGGRSGVE